MFLFADNNFYNPVVLCPIEYKVINKAKLQRFRPYDFLSSIAETILKK